MKIKIGYDHSIGNQNEVEFLNCYDFEITDGFVKFETKDPQFGGRRVYCMIKRDTIKLIEITLNQDRIRYDS